jgi:hypothetical protein
MPNCIYQYTPPVDIYKINTERLRKNILKRNLFHVIAFEVYFKQQTCYTLQNPQLLYIEYSTAKFATFYYIRSVLEQ